MQSAQGVAIGRDVPRVRTDALVFLGAFALCLLFRLPGLGDLPLWYDEVITADSIRMSWGGMVQERLSQGHLPTYFALLKALGLSGGSEWALRLPSAVLDAAAGGLVAVLARRIGGLAAVLPAALLYATLPILIVYGQEARPYALQLFFITLSMFGQISLLTGSDRPRRDAILATIGTLGAVTTILASVVIVALQHLAVIVSGALARGAAERRLWILHMAATWSVIAASLILLVPAVHEQAVRPEGLLKWTRGTPFLERVGGVAKGTLGFGFAEDIDRYLPQPFNLGLTIGLLVLVAAGLVALRRSRVNIYLPALVVGTCVAFGGIALFAAVANRYLIGMVPAVVLLASIGAVALVGNGRTRWFAAPVMVLFCACIVLQAFDTLASPRKYDWRPIAELLRDKGVRKTAVHSDLFLVKRELRYYTRAADGIEFKTIMSVVDPIEQLWKGTAGQPVAWFVLTADQINPPRTTPDAVLCNWSFGKMKVVMVTRDRASVPLAVEPDLANPEICLSSS